MTVEAFGQALPDLAAATKVWRPLFVMPEDVYAGAFRLMKLKAGRSTERFKPYMCAAIPHSAQLGAAHRFPVS